MKLGLKRPFARKLHKSPENRRNNVITDEKEILYLPLKKSHLSKSVKRKEIGRHRYSPVS